MLAGLTTAEFLLLEGLFWTLAAAVLCGVLYYRARRAAALLRDQVRELQSRQAARFLTREIVHTGELVLACAAADSDEARLLALRQRWLDIEQRALLEEGARKSDAAVIRRAAASMLALFDIKERASANRYRSAPSAARENPQKLLSQAKAVIQLQKQIIKDLTAKVASQQTHSEADGGAWNTTLEQAHSNAELQLASLARLERGLGDAREQFQQASQGLTLHRQTEGPPQEDHPRPAASQGVLVIRTGADGQRAAAAREVLDELERAHHESLIELRQMRETNVRQRNLILNLEKQIETLKISPEEQRSTTELLANLKAQLREYESCTATLELETEELRARIAALNGLIQSAESAGDISIGETLGHAHAQSGRAQHLLRQMRLAEQQLVQIAAVDSVERAVPAIGAWLELHGIDAAILVRDSEGRQYWFATHGATVDSQARQLLQSIGPATDSPWTDTKSGAIFAGTVLRVCVQHADLADFGELCRELTAPFRIIERLLKPLAAGGSQTGEALTASLATQIDAALAQHRFLLDETLRIGGGFYDELSGYMRELTVTDVQRECLQGMVEDFKADLTLLARAGRSVAHQLEVTGEMIAGRGAR